MNAVRFHEQNPIRPPAHSEYRSAAALQPLPRPDWLPADRWPFAPARLRVDGAGVAVTDTGTGPPLLFVHAGLWSFLWRDLILGLRGSFRCVAFDAPASGLSDPLPGSKVGLDRAARAAAAVIEALDLRDLTLIVHDLGGPAAIAGAACAPRRVRALVAVNSFAWRPSGAIFRAMLALMGSALMRELDAATGLLPRITASSFGVGRRMDAGSRAAFLAGIGARGVRTFHRYMRDARRCSSVYERAAAALDGPFRTLPLLTIFGQRNDPFDFQAQWKRRYPGARQLVIAKGNHFPMCDAPQLVAETIASWHRERVAPLTAGEYHG